MSEISAVGSWTCNNAKTNHSTTFFPRRPVLQHSYELAKSSIECKCRQQTYLVVREMLSQRRRFLWLKGYQCLQVVSCVQLRFLVPYIACWACCDEPRSRNTGASRNNVVVVCNILKLYFSAGTYIKYSFLLFKMLKSDEIYSSK